MMLSYDAEQGHEQQVTSQSQDQESKKLIHLVTTLWTHTTILFFIFSTAFNKLLVKYLTLYYKECLC